MVQRFITIAEAEILDKVDFVNRETNLDAHEVVLRKIARRGVRKPRAKIFTTNYDLCFEYAAQRQRFVILDGFSFTFPQVYDRSHFSLDIVRRDQVKEVPDYFENVFHLFKMHGSCDWARRDHEVVRGRNAQDRAALIYPRDSKYQEAFEPPYLDMMAAFLAAMREPDTTLIVSGFGFNDAHIAQPLMAAIESNMTLRIIVCDPIFVPGEKIEAAPTRLEIDGNQPTAFHEKLFNLARLGDQRIVLVNGRFADLADALPDLVAETERERHAERIAKLRSTGMGPRL